MRGWLAENVITVITLRPPQHAERHWEVHLVAVMFQVSTAILSWWVLLRSIRGGRGQQGIPGSGPAVLSLALWVKSAGLPACVCFQWPDEIKACTSTSSRYAYNCGKLLNWDTDLISNPVRSCCSLEVSSHLLFGAAGFLSITDWEEKWVSMPLTHQWPCFTNNLCPSFLPSLPFVLILSALHFWLTDLSYRNDRIFSELREI